MLSKYCADKPRVRVRILTYITLVYNTKKHKTTRATPFSVVFGAEDLYPVDLFYPQRTISEPMEEGFVEESTQVLREAHQPAELGTNQRRQKAHTTKRCTGTHTQLATECGFFANKKPFRRGSTFRGRAPTRFWNGFLT